MWWMEVFLVMNSGPGEAYEGILRKTRKTKTNFPFIFLLAEGRPMVKESIKFKSGLKKYAVLKKKPEMVDGVFRLSNEQPPG